MCERARLKDVWLAHENKHESMDINEVNIKRRFADVNQFAVPEGYFDSLTKRVMERIEDADAAEVAKPAKRVSLFARYAMCAVAACVAGFVMFVIPATRTSDDVAVLEELQSMAYDEEFSKEVLNYAMLDSEDVYAYLDGTNY